MGSASGSGRSPGGGDGNPLQYSCLENPMDRGAGQATVQGGHRESDMPEPLSMHECTVLRGCEQEREPSVKCGSWGVTWEAPSS